MNDNRTQALTVATPKELLAYLSKSKNAIEMALPKHLNADRMMRLAMTCFSTTPAIRNCSAQSILSSIVVASQLGLEPGIAGQGYLIPYKDTCTFVPGWQGLVSLLNNTGRATAWTGSVFDGDFWEFELGGKPRCMHVPGENYGDAEKLIWVYACGQVNGSDHPVIEAWPVSRVLKHRDKYNKVGPRHYSFQNFEMYARKVVLLQVLKYMPRSIELNNAIVAANADDAGKPVTVDNGVVIEVSSQTSTDDGATFQQANTDEPPMDPLAEKRTHKPPVEEKADVKTEPAKTAEPVESFRDSLKRLMESSGVVGADGFDGFKSVIKSRNIALGVDYWKTWDDVPEQVCEQLHALSKVSAEIIRKFGNIQQKEGGKPS